MLHLLQGGNRMKAMKVVKGKVVGRTVVIEESLPEGLEVEVRIAETGDDDYELTEEMEADLAQAMEESRRGEGIMADVSFARLPPIETP